MKPNAWHQSQWQQLLTQKNPAHAILFHGPAGIGKHIFVNAWIQYLLCLAPQADSACHSCNACKQVQAQTHPNLLVLEAEGSRIKIDAIRRAIAIAHQTQFTHGPKIIYLPEAEKLSVQSANALLKSLEEPAGETIFILVAIQVSFLLPTLLSRCRKIALPAPTTELAPDSSTYIEFLAQFVTVINGEMAQATWLESVKRDYAPEQILAYFMQWILQVLMVQAGISLPKSSLSIQPQLQILAQRFEPGRLFALWDRFTQWQMELQQKINHNKDLLLDNMFNAIVLSTEGEHNVRGR